MDVQTLEAVLQFVKERKEELNRSTPCGGAAHKLGMYAAYDGLILSLRKTIQLEADIGAEDMTLQENIILQKLWENK